MKEEEVVKVHIDLPNHWAIGGESLWAIPLGDDLYRIENIPFYAYGLNFRDVVRATSDSNQLIPEIRELVEESGHRTFRLFFRKEISREQQEVILSSLRQLHLSFERANHLYVAVDMTPAGHYQAVFNRLEEYESQEILGFETCEARIEGSFDDLPEDEAD